MNTFRKIILALLLFFSFFLGSASASYVTDGLVAQYDWLQDSGSNVIDVSGTGNNGTNSGSVLVDIGNGKKYRTFANASSQYISVPTSTSLNFSTAFTIEVWCKPSIYQDKTKNVNVLAKENTFNLQLGSTSGASVFVLTVRNATDYNHFGGAYAPILNNNWHQLVATYNGTTRNVVLYDDTSVFSSTSGAAVPTSIDLSSSPLVIGAFSPTYGFFNGSIALVRIYNRSLSADEVENNFNNTVKEVTVELPFSVEVSGGTVLFDVQVFEAGRIVWKESSDDHSAVVRHILPGFPANTAVEIKKNGTLLETVSSNASGYVDWTYTGGFSEHTFEASVADIQDYVNNSIWQSALGMILVAVVVFFGTMLYKGIKKGKVESDTIILAAKGLLFIAMTLMVGAVILSAF